MYRIGICDDDKILCDQVYEMDRGKLTGYSAIYQK